VGVGGGTERKADWVQTGREKVAVENADVTWHCPALYSTELMPDAVPVMVEVGAWSMVAPAVDISVSCTPV